MKVKIVLVGMFLFLALAATGLRAEDICTTAVKTEAGLVAGLHETGTDTCVWRGIPYAAPPVGELRWKAPQPAVPWTGIRTASKWGNRCIQSGIMEYVNSDPSRKMSEDCLFLNVWRPNKPGKFPVMFWIHGGGYSGGTGNSPMYWGDRMAAAGDVVVVSINYRLNIFGFLTLPGLRDEDPNQSVGSYGSLDQVAALKWARNNVAKFGGDPDNVTIFGESAGGWSVCSMLATPLAKGLFAKAIIESGGCEASPNLERGYNQGKGLAEQLKCGPDDLACLRKLPAKKLLSALESELSGGFVYGPHLDGYFLTATPLATIRSGNFNNVPLIAGFNDNEANALAKLDRDLSKAKPDQYTTMMTSLFEVSPEESDRLASLYPLSAFENSPKIAYGQIATDAALACPTYLGLASAAKNQKDVYLYRFDWHNMLLGKTIGAVHSLEMPFVFDSADRRPLSLLLKNRGVYKDEMKTLSRTVQDYWLSFAKSGNPNREGLPVWPVFQADSQKTQVLDANVRAESFGPELQDRCAFWDEYSKTHNPVHESLGVKK